MLNEKLIFLWTCDFSVDRLSDYVEPKTFHKAWIHADPECAAILKEFHVMSD